MFLAEGEGYLHGSWVASWFSRWFLWLFLGSFAMASNKSSQSLRLLLQKTKKENQHCKD